MWDRDLVSRLSSKAAQVLLSLLLTREIETQQTAAEFAKLTGLGQRSIAPALLELRDAGLIDIVPQPGKPSLVRLVHPELASATQVGEYRYDVSVTEADPEAVGPVGKPALLAGGSSGAGHPTDNSASSKGVGAADSEGIGGVSLTKSFASGGGLAAPGEHPVLQRPGTLIDQCRMADESKDSGLRVAALQDVWDFAFPFDEYPDPTQRMSNGFAQRLLVNRSAEWVGRVILDSVQHATSRIQAPRAYIQKAVDMEERRGLGSRSGSESVITDEVRRAAQLGKELFGEKNSEGYF